MTTPTFNDWLCKILSHVKIDSASDSIAPSFNDWIAFLKAVKVISVMT
jgi:hypothetical protein